MSFKKNVETMQIALELLGYNLPRFGVDGLFGPETKNALNDFKKDNNIEINDGYGVFDESSKNIMINLLNSKGITDKDIEQYTLPNQEFSSLDGDIKHSYSGKAAKNIQLLINTMKKHGVNDPVAQLGMLAVIGKETHFINKKEKGYHNTSNQRIRRIFSRPRSLSDSSLNDLKSDYNRFFDFVYNGRIGNNNEHDGSKYVGRGFNQLTGKGNYRKHGNAIGIDLVSNPDIMLDDNVAAEVAVRFLTKRGVPEFNNPNEATLYFADINSGSPKTRARNSSIKELQKFDIVSDSV